MKKTILALLVFLISCSSSRLLTPEIVIPGGYCSYVHEDLFPSKNGKVVFSEDIEYSSNKDLSRENIQVFAHKIGKIILNTDNKLIFDVSFKTGNHNYYTPVGVFDRHLSVISFTATIVFRENMFRYILNDFNLERRILKDAWNKISRGDPNELHYQRMNILVRDRNDYVDVVIKERKTEKNLKEKYVEKIKRMDERIELEEISYINEYEAVDSFIEELLNNEMESFVD